MSECKTGSCCSDVECDITGEIPPVNYTNAERADSFLCLARQAHHELLKEKMKAAFQAKIGAKMDKVAALVVETALVAMQHKMEEDQKRETYEEKLMDIYKGKE